MQYNLYSPINEPLRYPHHTKIENGEVFVVTHPERIIKVDDVICAEGSGVPTMGKRKVLAVLEQREANGQHSVDFVPVFQKLKTKLI